MIAPPPRPVSDAPAQDRTPRMRFYDAAPSPWSPLRLSGGACCQGHTAAGGMIVAVVAGELTASDGGNPQTVRGGQMILIPPGTSYTLESRGAANAMACLFDGESLAGYLPGADKLIAAASGDAPAVFRTLPFGIQLGAVISQTQQYIDRGLGTETLLAIKRQEFLCLLFSIHTPEELAAFLAPVLGREAGFRNLVSDHWQEAGNVQRLAALSGYSISGFIKKFGRVYGQPPYRWMQARRAELILREVRLGCDPFKEIARRHRFSSYQHFAEFCVRHFGATPTALRAEQPGAPAARPEVRPHAPVVRVPIQPRNPIRSKKYNSA